VDKTGAANLPAALSPEGIILDRATPSHANAAANA
jgi:hypothetical protein